MGGSALVIRTLVALLGLAFALPLLGASGFAPPVVVIYPITSSGDVDRATGGNISLALATRMTQIGSVTVKPAVPGTERAKYLDAAIAIGADYYITGFLTPIGADASLVTQVVSTHSGSVVFSTTATVKTYGDAIAQAEVLQAALLRHAGRGLAALDAPPPAPSASPPPNANAGSLDIGKVLGKRKRGEPTPTPTPTSTTSAPSRIAAAAAAPATSPSPAATTAAAVRISYGTLLFAVAGALEGDRATVASRAIVDGFRRVNRSVGILNVPLGANLGNAAAICAANAGTRELANAFVVEGQDEAGDLRVQLDLATYDCAGRPLVSKRATATARKREGFADAVARAAFEATASINGR